MSDVTESSSLIDLVRAAQAGRSADLDGLLAKLRPLVCRWAVVWTGNPDAAEDIAQTVLIRVDKSLGSLQPEGRVTTWVYRITKNVLIDYDRSRGRDRALQDQLRLEEIARASVGHGAGSFEALDLLQHLMVSLSPQQRAALDLVDLQGFSAQEAAEMLEVAPATVRVHLHRARQVLRSRIEGGSSVDGGSSVEDESSMAGESSIGGHDG